MAEQSRLLAKKNANDPSWQALKARADTLATYSINQYKFASSSAAPPATIFYNYQGEGWYDAALPLAFAYQMTGDTKYSNKLVQLAQEMIRAQSGSIAGQPAGGEHYRFLARRKDNQERAHHRTAIGARRCVDHAWSDSRRLHECGFDRYAGESNRFPGAAQSRSVNKRQRNDTHTVTDVPEEISRPILSSPH